MNCKIDTTPDFARDLKQLAKRYPSMKDDCNRLTLIAFTQTRDVEIGGKTIHIISALDRLLRYGTENPEQREQS